MTKYNIDSIDRRILSYLIENARIPFLEIARECGISGSAIHQRIKKLEDAGIITGSCVEVDPKALGYGVCAFVGIQFSNPEVSGSVIESLEEIPQVVECHFITGRNTLLVKVFSRDNKNLIDIIINTILKIPEVSQTETFVSLEKSFQRQLNVYEADNK